MIRFVSTCQSTPARDSKGTRVQGGGDHICPSRRAKKGMGSVDTRLILVTRVADRVAFPFRVGMLGPIMMRKWLGQCSNKPRVLRPLECTTYSLGVYTVIWTGPCVRRHPLPEVDKNASLHTPRRCLRSTRGIPRQEYHPQPTCLVLLKFRVRA